MSCRDRKYCLPWIPHYPSLLLCAPRVCSPAVVLCSLRRQSVPYTLTPAPLLPPQLAGAGGRALCCIRAQHTQRVVDSHSVWPHHCCAPVCSSAVAVHAWGHDCGAGQRRESLSCVSGQQLAVLCSQAPAVPHILAGHQCACGHTGGHAVGVCR